MRLQCKFGSTLTANDVVVLKSRVSLICYEDQASTLLYMGYTFDTKQMGKKGKAKERKCVCVCVCVCEGVCEGVRGCGTHL